MPTDIAFRLSTYITLALACANLGYAEWDLLPEASICSFIVGGLMILTFTQEGKWELSLTAANRLGLVIGILTTVWIAFQIVRPSGGLIYNLPWPAGLLPYIGPLIMVLMPAKLFRPKHVGDWWTMHGVGLAAVALACTLADSLVHGILVALYLICGAWSLSLFYLRRAAGGVPLIPGRPDREPRSLVVTGDFSSAPKTLLGRAFAARPIWTLMTAASIGTLFFFITPRIDGPSWSLSSNREVGYNAEESAPDLNRGGSLATTNREIAFVAVIKKQDGTPKLDLPSEQLWRGRSFAMYEAGKWQPQTVMKWLIQQPARGLVPMEESPENWTIEYEWKAKRKDAILATPVYWQPDRLPPVSSDTPYGRFAWSQSPDGFFYPVTKESFGRYQQTNRTPLEANLGTYFELVRNSSVNERILEADPYREFDFFTRCDLPRVRDYGRALLTKLAEKGKFSKDILKRLDPASRNVAVDDQEAVAVAFRDYIADSGEFAYEAKSPPPSKDVDPVEEFLLTQKTGTCERFATGLTMLLRSVGIPARIVIGFKGCENDDHGRYIVRQENAHAWCEVLIRRPTPKNYESQTAPRPRHVFAWLNLDPTPGDGSETTTATGIVGSVQSAWQSFGDWFTSFVSKYNPDARERLGKNVAGGLKRWWPTVVLGVLSMIIASAIWRMLKQARLKTVKPVKSASSLPDWYARFLEFASLKGVPRLQAETPIEHAKRLANKLPTGQSDLPRRIAVWLTALRYGQIEPDSKSVSAAVRELDASK